MSFKKNVLTVAAVTALTAATAVPAMALENEFHGMYRMLGFATNAETGGTAFNLEDSSQKSFYVEQRARIAYNAKVNDDLKLMTQFELDARFGGSTAAKYQTSDAGGLDADQVSIETKNIYLDFNIPSTPVNFKVGLQPYTDAIMGVFGSFDATGAIASAKFGPVTPSLGWFRLSDNMYTAGNTILPGDNTADLIVADVKYAVNKNLNVGAFYYNVQNDQGTDTVLPYASDYQLLHTIGLNAGGNVGPASLTGSFAYQWGDYTGSRDLSAWAATAVAKVALGPGKLNLSTLYLSGDEGDGTGDFKSFRQLATNGAVSYFNPANMWLLVRNVAMINSSTAVGGLDLTKGGLGFWGIFGGYEMSQGRLFGSANVGWARVDEKRGADGSTIGTELNATIGYKLFDNLSASLTGAYLFLGDGVTDDTARFPWGVANADDPFLANIQLNYVF